MKSRAYEFFTGLSVAVAISLVGVMIGVLL